MLRRLAGLFFALVLVALAAAPALAVRTAPAPDWNPATADGNFTAVTGGAIARNASMETMPRAPIAVQTSTASEVTTSSAILHGYLDGMGPYPSVIVWFEFGNTTGFGRSTSQMTLYNTGPFSIQVSGLNPNSGYYFRAAARPNAVGVTSAYGHTNIFTTTGAAAIDVNTGAPSNVTATSATIVGYLQSLGSYRSAYVWFEWGASQGYGQTTPMQTMYNPGQYNFTLQNLNPGTTYNYRALAVPVAAGTVTVHGFNGSFTTTFAPGIKVGTSTASNVGNSSATFNGVLTSMGTSSLVTTWFEYGTDATFGNSTAQQTLDAPGNFSFSITGLRPATTYYYRAAAFSNNGNVYGSYSTFQTTSQSPVAVYTNPASSVSANTATLNANVGAMGSARSVNVYFNYGTDNQMGSTTLSQAVNSPGTVSFQLTNLVPGTNYIFQAVAETPDGHRIYGGQEIFTTVANSKIAVTTQPATGISSNGAILNGSLNALGNTSTVQVWFEYGTTADYGNSTEIQAMSTTGPFSTPVTGLAPGRNYYYRTVALNPTGGGKSVAGPATMFTTNYSSGGGSGPTPGPIGETPAFVWFIMGGFVIVIIILIILLASRRA